MLPQGLRTWLDGDSRSRHRPGQAWLSPLPCLGSRLMTLPSSLSPAQSPYAARGSSGWPRGKGPPVCFPQFPKGEPTHVTFQRNEHPGKCSWFQSFLDALASPKKTGLQSNVSVFSRPQADSRTCWEKHCHSVSASTTSTWGGGCSGGQVCTKAASEYTEEPLTGTKAPGSTSSLRTQGASAR